MKASAGSVALVLCAALSACSSFELDKSRCSQNVAPETQARLHELLAEEVYDVRPNGTTYSIAGVERSYNIEYFICDGSYFIETFPKSFEEINAVVTGGPRYYKVDRQLTQIRAMPSYDA
jgi:hypothetical protein